jgi:pilus assembly protein CpaD
MKNQLRLVVLPLTFGLAACAAEYSKSEAPAQLRVDSADSRREVAFTSGSAHLSPSELRKIDGWVLSGSIRPADRVEIAAAGPPGLAEQRAAAISGELLRYGVVATTLALDTVPANQAIVSIGRYAVTLPTCPNWSQSPAADFTNAYSSYYGCDDATNLGLMVASPADLVSGRPLSATNAQVTGNAVQRYLTDRVKPPPNPTPSPFGGGGGGGGDSGGGGGGGGGGAPGGGGP